MENEASAAKSTTVAELRAMLAGYPADWNVVVPDHYGGVNDVRGAEGVRIQRDVGWGEYYGRHDVLHEDDAGTPAVLLT